MRLIIKVAYWIAREIRWTWRAMSPHRVHRGPDCCYLAPRDAYDKIVARRAERFIVRPDHPDLLLWEKELDIHDRE